MRIQANDGVAGSGGKRNVDAAGQPAPGIIEHLDLEGCGFCKCLHQRARFVGGCAVHQQRFDLFGQNGLREQVLKQRANARCGVVRHDDKADSHHTIMHRICKNGGSYACV